MSLKNPWRGLRGLPKEMWLLAFAVFINRSGMMVLPFLVLYLTRALHFSPSEAGFVLTSYGLAALATAPLAGKLSDRLGPLRVMKYSLALSGVLLILLPLVQQYAFIVGVVIVWSMISEAFRPSSLAFITDITEVEQRKAAFALNRLAINLGMSVGPALGGFLFLISYHFLFWVDGLTALAAAGLLFLPSWRQFLRSPHEFKTEDGVASVEGTSAYRNPQLLYFLFAIIPVLIVFFQHEAAMPLFLVRDLQLPESSFGLMFTINTVLIILVEVPLNIATAHRSNRVMLSLGAFLVGLGFGSMAFATGFWSVALTVVIWTFGEMIFLPTAATYMAEIAPPERRGEYMGLFQMVFSLGFALSALFGTGMLEQFGATVLWGTTFVAGCVSAVMLWRVRSS